MTFAKPFRDTFSRDRRRGRVVGSESDDGARRAGVDVEGVLSIDHGALRIQPLIEAGWNRACLSYGPFERRAGLVLGVSMVNGHNTSQAEQLPDTLQGRLRRWLTGPETERARERALKWLTTGRVRRVIRQFRWWARTAKDRKAVERLDENLAVGWFPRADSHPMHEGSAFVMHATGPENGELWRRVGGGFQPVIRGVQNLHIYYVVALRPDSAVYYAASVPRAHGLSPYPLMRPLGIDPGSGGEREVWASIHQSLLGQIGFRLDTRVYGVGVAELADWTSWHGGAQAADELRGEGPLAGSVDALGCRWVDLGGSLQRSAAGVVPGGGEGACALEVPGPSGLIRVRLRNDGRDACAATLRWRMRDPSSFWELRLSAQALELAVVLAGLREIVASAGRTVGPAGELQVVDDGRTLAISLAGEFPFGRLLEDRRLADERGLAIALLDDGTGSVSAGLIEAHPREIPLPAALDFGKPWFRTGNETLVADDFSRAAGELDASRTPVGDKPWQRIFGNGRFELTGDGSVRVCATRQQPINGRVMYSVDWDREDFADIEVDITPPGTRRGEGENGLAGVVAWQDDDNYVTINSWTCDGYPGASMSCFFRIRGWEDLYDAIWSNVGARVRHGHPYRMRLVFDGTNYIVFVDDEPVVYRALTDVYPDCKPLRIRRVGIITNWEWGRDTGSVFRNFRVRY
jgi:hypothetical protein